MKKRLLALLLAMTCTSSFAFTAGAVNADPVPDTQTPETVQSVSNDPPILEDDPMAYRVQQSRAAVQNANADDTCIEQAGDKATQYSFLTQKNYKVPSGKNVFHGIDVSYYNNGIQWNTVKNAGVDFAIIRVGYRGYGSSGNMKEDPNFHTYMKGAANVDMPVGVYIFSQAITPQEAVEEANFVLQRIKNYQISLPVVMDYEFFGDEGRLYDAHLSKAQMTENALAFCDTVRKAGHTPMVYANKSFLTNNVYADQIEAVAPIWLAHYTTNTDYSGKYDYWQYAEKGSVAGVESTYVDANFLFADGDLIEGDSSTVKGFTDVLSSSWYAEAIAFAIDHKLMSGVSATKFAPNDYLTRSMVAQILYSLAGSPKVSYSNVFTDVKDGKWYTDAIMWAKQNNIMSGVSSNKFGVTTEITREQIATTLYSFSKKYNVSVSKVQNLNAYTDASKISSYAVTPMKWAVANHILTGRTSTTLVPKGLTNRAECAMILKAYLTGVASHLL